MPDTGTPYFLPYPTLGDETDANKYLKLLADAQDAALKALVPRSARSKTTPQPIVTVSTFETIMFDNEEALPQGSVAIPYSAGIWTIQRPGVYMISATAHLQFSGIPQWRLALSLTGSRPGSPTVTVVAAGANSNGDVVKAVRLIAGDTVCIQALCSTAGTIYGTTTRYTNCDVTWIAP